MKLVLALVAGVMAATPTGKVIELLDELKGKVENDLANEGKAMEEYTEYCDDELTEKAYAIKTAKREISGFEAAIEDASGKYEKNTALLEELGADIAKKQAELAEAKKVRSGENKDFVAAEKELVDSVDMLGRAIVVMKRGGSFIQGKSGSQKFEDIAQGLNAVVMAAGSWGVSPKDQLALKSFLQNSDDDLSLAQQPQAASYNYENHSGGIVSTLNDMKDKAEATLADLRREEMKAKHAYEMLAQSLSDAVSVAEKDAANAQSNQSSASEAKAKAEGNLAATQASKAADEKYSARLDEQCKAKASEWAARQKSGAAEIKAISEAKDVLQGGVKVSLAQTSMSVVKSKDSSNRYEAVSILKKLGRKYSSYGLLELASKAGSDPFGKVRGLINNMIDKLQKQAQEEATHDSFCKEELAKSTKSKETKENRADKYSTRIDQAKAGIADLHGSIADLQSELADIASATKKATAIRNSENAAYKKASKDYKESIEAVTSAIATLTDFYRGGSFIQTAQPELGAARGDAGHMIIEILAQAESDFSGTLAEIEADEAEAKSAFEELIQDNKVAKSTKEAEVKGKQSEIKSLEVALGNHKSDLSTVSKELDAVLAYLSKLKPQCESKAMSYEERKERRDAEIAGLKDALDLLQGNESFLQLARKARVAKQMSM
jgi:hypothetical protein